MKPALNYYKETGNPAAAHLMMAFANTENEGLIVLATHRLVSNLENFDAEKFIVSLKENSSLRHTISILPRLNLWRNRRCFRR